MSKNTRWSADDLSKKGLVQNESGDYVPIKSLVNTGKVEKLPSLIEQCKPYVDSITESQTKIQAIINKSNNTGKGKMKAAVKTELDGIQFDSKLESFMYTLLRGSGITFDMQKEYLLQPGFRYNGEAVRAIKIVVDFWLPSRNIIIDTKGYQFRDGTIKYKMLKKYFFDTMGSERLLPTIHMPKDKEECRVLLNKLLYEIK